MEIAIGNHIILFDDIDYELVAKHRWSVYKSGNTYYANTNIRNGKHFCHYKMHRLMLNLQNGELCDHINGNGLDNRRCNLRKCTRAQNSRNRNIPNNNTSGYMGVIFIPDDSIYKPWIAQIGYDNKHYRIGNYPTKEEAALAYNQKATELFGEFARLNVVPQEHM